MSNNETFKTNSETMYRAAKTYTENGLKIIPISSPTSTVDKAGKSSILSSWSERTTPMSEDELNRYWKNGGSVPNNIAVLCGEINGNLVLDFDADNPIIRDLLKGIDQSNWIKQYRTNNRSHCIFSYDQRFAKKCNMKEIDIDILSNKSYCIIEPSNHPSGDVYKFNPGLPTEPKDLPKMPEELVSRLLKLFDQYERFKRFMAGSLPCAKAYLKAHAIGSKDPENWHGEEGKNAALVTAIEFALQGANEDDLYFLAKVMYINHYDHASTKDQIKSVLEFAKKNKHWRCDTIKNKCSMLTVNGAGNSICDTCEHSNKFNNTQQEKPVSRDLDALDKAMIEYEMKQAELADKKREEEEREEVEGRGGKESSGKETKEKIKQPVIPHNAVGVELLRRINLFTVSDTEEIFVYRSGVYGNEYSNEVLQKCIRDIYSELYKAEYYRLNGENHKGLVPAKGRSYVADVIEWIKAYTKVSRRDIDKANVTHLNFRNGLFNLNTWKLEPHTPKILSIVQFNVTYNPEATCPMIDKYMRTCELTDKDIRDLMEFSGYGLTVDMAMQQALMLLGGGSNGKSVFINLIKTLMGEQAVSNESLHTLENDKYRVANLYGKRLNAFPDLKDEPLQTNEVFNVITGGDLELTGERKYQHSFRFRPTTKMLFSANKPPFAYSDNFAYFRRWIIIEFKHTFTDEDKDKGLLAKLTTEDELSGLLNKMLAGLKTVLENGKFSYDLTVEEVERLYKVHSDNVTIFVNECTREVDDDYEYETDKDVVYTRYCAWCEWNNLKPETKAKFSRRMKKLGHEPWETTITEESGRRSRLRCFKNTVLIYAKTAYSQTVQATL